MTIENCRQCEGMNYTEEDIGEEIEIEIESVKVWDQVIELMLPNGTTIIGPSLTCGHIFARFTMLPAMIAASDATRKQMEDFE